MAVFTSLLQHLAMKIQSFQLISVRTLDEDKRIFLWPCILPGLMFWLPRLLVMWPSLLCCSFLICKRSMIIVPASGDVFKTKRIKSWRIRRACFPPLSHLLTDLFYLIPIGLGYRRLYIWIHCLYLRIRGSVPLKKYGILATLEQMEHVLALVPHCSLSILLSPVWRSVYGLV